MDNLISRLESATEGSRELDAEIAEYVGVRHRSRRTFDGKNKGREWLVDSHGGVETWSQDPPRFSRSIDAARALGPGGCYCWSDSTGYAEVVRRGTGFLSERGDEEFAGKGATEALGACIAALKARKAGDGK